MAAGLGFVGDLRGGEGTLLWFNADWELEVDPLWGYYGKVNHTFQRPSTAAYLRVSASAYGMAHFEGESPVEVTQGF